MPPRNLQFVAAPCRIMPPMHDLDYICSRIGAALSGSRDRFEIPALCTSQHLSPSLRKQSLRGSAVPQTRPKAPRTAKLEENLPSLFPSVSAPKPQTRSPRSLCDLRDSPETKSPRPLSSSDPP